jgi:hypothetical protein
MHDNVRAGRKFPSGFCESLARTLVKRRTRYCSDHAETARAKAAWAEILSPAHPCLEEFPAALALAEYPGFAAEYPAVVF